MSRAFSSSIEMIIWFIYFICTCANVIYHINWFADVETSLCPWDKSHLIWMYHPFSALFNLLIFCWEFFYVYEWYWPVSFIFMCCLCFWYQGDAGCIECVWKYPEYIGFFFFLSSSKTDYGHRSSSHSSLATHDCLVSIFVLFEIFSVVCYLVIKNIKQKLLHTEGRP